MVVWGFWRRLVAGGRALSEGRKMVEPNRGGRAGRGKASEGLTGAKKERGGASGFCGASVRWWGHRATAGDVRDGRREMEPTDAGGEEAGEADRVGFGRERES